MTMNTDLMFSSATDLWATPRAFFDKYNAVHGFELDVCANAENAKCEKFYTVVEDGLAQEWTGNVWMNPPYGTTACKWDSVIPLEPMWEQLKRIIKPNGAIVLFGGQPFTSILICSNLKMYRYDWVWEKDKGANWMFGNKQPLKVHENVSVFYSNQPNYLPQKTLNPKGESKRHLSKNPSKITGNVKDVMGVNWSETEMDETLNYHGKDYDPKMLLPRSVQKFSREAKGKVHPTQKPVALMEYLIKTYTLEGETVLDFTMGSGTTGVACKNLNRNFIGIEKDEAYFKIAQARIGVI